MDSVPTECFVVNGKISNLTFHNAVFLLRWGADHALYIRPLDGKADQEPKVKHRLI